MRNKILLFYTLTSRFTGITNRVNRPAGKTLRGFCLLSSQGNLRGNGGDAKSLKAGSGYTPRGQLRRFMNNILQQEQTMNDKNMACLLLPKVLLATLIVGALFMPTEIMAHDGDLLRDEISAVEKLFTGGYMRVGLLGVCGFAAIYGIIKQSGWIFASGVLGCVFAYFMKDWILRTFTLVI